MTSYWHWVDAMLNCTNANFHKQEDASAPLPRQVGTNLKNESLLSILLERAQALALIG
jgi:hypothetical protein